MNLAISLITGGLIGCIAGMIMSTDAQQGIALNVIVGIVGALLGQWGLSPLVGVLTTNQAEFSIVAFALSLAGALVLLVVVNQVLRDYMR